MHLSEIIISAGDEEKSFLKKIVVCFSAWWIDWQSVRTRVGVDPCSIEWGDEKKNQGQA